jgi:hypothetical protein
MKGAGEVGWTYEDYDNAFGDGSFNLSNLKIWGTEEGKRNLNLHSRIGFMIIGFRSSKAAQK